jgi:twitching motility protein PilT
MQLSVTLEGVVCQALLPKNEAEGRVAAFEIMLATPAIRALIREGKTHQIYNSIQMGQDEGMIVLDQYLAELVQTGQVVFEDALAKSSYPGEFAHRCGLAVSTDEQIDTAGEQPKAVPQT